ncbi:MAG: pyrroline-5-carboxylate reductase [Alphaproteobacteria bacterium]
MSASKVLSDFSGGLVLLGAGRMGLAMAKGWLESGLPASELTAIEPYPSDDLLGLAGVDILSAASDFVAPPPAVAVIAVKPQMMADILPAAANLFGPQTLVISIAAGTSLEKLAALTGPELAIIRAMPNTPAAIGQGITALCANVAASPAHLTLASELMTAVGKVVVLESEGQMDAVTALSGSGPAYVFHMVECMAASGQRLGLPEQTAMELARATVAGAGGLLAAAPESAAELRQAVTSPGGTTAAALDVLMGADGLREVMGRALEAAASRSKELAD